MDEYQRIISETYKKIKNLKYTKEVFGLCLIAGGVLTEFYFCKKNMDQLGIVNSFPLLLFGFHYFIDGIANKANIFYRNDAMNKDNLEKKNLENKFN